MRSAAWAQWRPRRPAARADRRRRSPRRSREAAEEAEAHPSRATMFGSGELSSEIRVEVVQRVHPEASVTPSSPEPTRVTWTSRGDDTFAKPLLHSAT